MNTKIREMHNYLSNHPVYKELASIENIRIFMKFHVFAVWDFMSLLKSLQGKMTCIEVPWRESKYSSELVRLINEIVLGEESDIDQNGHATSHFSLYLKAMKEIGADTNLISEFLRDLDFERLPYELREIVGYHLNVASQFKTHEVAASFFFGREKLIPDMFESIVKILNSHSSSCPTLVYYLERHIQVDSENHGPKALQCLNELIDSEEKKKESLAVALKSLQMRCQLWDYTLKEIRQAQTLTEFSSDQK